MKSFFRMMNRIEEIKTSFRRLNRSGRTSASVQDEPKKTVPSSFDQVLKTATSTPVTRGRKSVPSEPIYYLDPPAKRSGLHRGTGSPKPIPSQYLGLIDGVAKKYELPRSLLRSIIKVESNFNPRAVSSKGAMGLMQLMPQTAEKFGVSSPFDPQANLEGGARYFKSLLTQYQGNLMKALAAYNAGPEAVSSKDRVPNFPETQDYVKKVISNYLEKNGVSK